MFLKMGASKSGFFEVWLPSLGHKWTCETYAPTNVGGKSFMEVHGLLKEPIHYRRLLITVYVNTSLHNTLYSIYEYILIISEPHVTYIYIYICIIHYTVYTINVYIYIYMYIYTLLYYKCYRYTNHILEPPVRPEGEGAQVYYYYYYYCYYYYYYYYCYYYCYYHYYIIQYIPPVRPEGEGAQVEAAVLRRKLLVARMCVYIYIYIYSVYISMYTHMYTCTYNTYIYIYIQRERDTQYMYIYTHI